METPSKDTPSNSSTDTLTGFEASPNLGGLGEASAIGEASAGSFDGVFFTFRTVAVAVLLLVAAVAHAGGECGYDCQVRKAQEAKAAEAADPKVVTVTTRLETVVLASGDRATYRALAELECGSAGSDAMCVKDRQFEAKTIPALEEAWHDLALERGGASGECTVNFVTWQSLENASKTIRGFADHFSNSSNPYAVAAAKGYYWLADDVELSAAAAFQTFKANGCTVAVSK